MYALSLANGKVASGWPVDVQAGLHADQSPSCLYLSCVHLPDFPAGAHSTGHAAALAKIGKTFLSENQNQRGALTLLNGILYVPYGGAITLDATLWPSGGAAVQGCGVQLPLNRRSCAHEAQS